MTKILSNSVIPEVLYKYRSWSNDDHRKTISNQEIYLPRPSEFNDPFDGNIPVRWDLLTYEDRFAKNLSMLEIVPQGRTRKELIALAKQYTEDGTWWPTNPQKESPEQIEKWDKIIGLYSLTESCSNILMWTHYADNHRGFAIGFNMTTIIELNEFNFLDKVNYQLDYPLIHGNHEIHERFHKRFFTKSDLWSYEVEWRLTKNHVKNRIVVLNRDCFNSIVLGCQMSQKDRVEIASIARNTFGAEFPIFQMNMAPDKYELNISPV